MIIFNPLEKFFKSELGAVCANKEITFRAKVFGSVVFVYRKDGDVQENRVQMEKNGDYSECTVKFDVGLYWYKFDLDGGNFIGEGKKLCGIITDKPKEYQLSVYSNDYSVPKWLNGGIIYQIFPDRFCSSGDNLKETRGRVIHTDKNDTPIFMPNEYGKVLNNDFFGGDLKGIISKLDYINSLGVNIIYLNPIFKAYSNHRYDTGDYMQIDHFLGTEEDLICLINKCNEKGIKIVLDGVFNHTGDDSLYFNKYGNYNSLGAFQSTNSPYYEWYNFIEYPNKYDAWWGIETLPAINEKNSGFIDYITGENGVLSHYTKLGIGGWRLDVVDELPAPFVQKIRDAVKKVNDEAVIIGEVWEDASNKVAYGVRREYFLGKELDSVMNYPLKNAIIDYVKNANVEALSYVVNTQIDHYPDFVLNSVMNLLSTHDTVRLISAVGDYDYYGQTKTLLADVKLNGEILETAKFRLKCATLLQYTLKGVPSIYYGDEIGMQGYMDPLNRRFFEWDNIDNNLLDWFKLLGNIRTKYDAFSGDYKEIYAQNGVFVFKRTGENSELLIAINLGDKEYNLNFDGQLVNLLDEKRFENTIKLTKKFLGIFKNEKL